MVASDTYIAPLHSDPRGTGLGHLILDLSRRLLMLFESPGV